MGLSYGFINLRMESKFIFLLTIITICDCLPSARDYPSRLLMSPSQNQKKTPGRQCYFRNHKKSCRNGTSCEVVKTCENGSYCYSLYNNKTSQMLLKGCWLPDDQGGNSCSSAKCKFQAVRSPPYYFCCCNTDLCNHSIPPPIKVSGRKKRKTI